LIPLTVEGYIDTYFSFDFNEPENSTIPYVVSYNRHHEFNINLAYISLKYNTNNIKAVFTPGYGTYMDANYINERASLKNIVEAYVSIRIFKDKEIWLDAGVIPSPYTYESPIAIDQINYSRCYAPEYTPYFLTGTKLSLPITKNTLFSVYLVNGWQEIRDVNHALALGTHLEIKPNSNLSFNWNTFIGNEQSVSTPDYRNRFFTDAYCTYYPNKNWMVSSSIYVGMQEKINTNNNTSEYAWYQGNIAAKYNITEKNSISSRIEYYSDYNRIMITPIIGNTGFDTFSGVLGYNLLIAKDILFRLEGKYLLSNQMVFERNNSAVKNNFIMLVGLNARFNSK
jgi:hypothetical protein